MIDVGAALTRKIGPLPAVAWGAIVGGGILVARVLRGGAQAGSSSSPTILGATAEDGAGGGGAGSGAYDPNADTTVPTATVPASGFNPALLGPPNTIGATTVPFVQTAPRPATISMRHIAAR